MRTLEWHDLSWNLRLAPKPVLELMKKHGQKIIVAGGFVRSCISREPISDIDLFSPSKEAAKIFAKELSGGDKFIETDNAFTVIKKARFSIQFIHRWTYETPETLLNSFDFTIARAAFWWNQEEKKWLSLCDDGFYADLAAKRLIYCSPQRAEDAGGSLLRVLKFYQRGYRIPLDSFSACIARLIQGVDIGKISGGRDETEKQWAKVLCGLLREVDPNVDPNHISHLPAEPESGEQEVEQ